MLYQLSYASRLEVERETGIEPATNSLEGCDSTTELLPLRSPPFYQTRTGVSSKRSAACPSPTRRFPSPDPNLKVS